MGDVCGAFPREAAQGAAPAGDFSGQAVSGRVVRVGVVVSKRNDEFCALDYVEGQAISRARTTWVNHDTYQRADVLYTRLPLQSMQSRCTRLLRKRDRRRRGHRGGSPRHMKLLTYGPRSLAT